MATTKKTTIRRYNGTDWDIIYLATTSDITSLGVAITVADNTTPWEIGDVVAASESVQSILTKVINRIQYIDNTRLTAIENGTAITALAAAKITGTLANSQLPDDVHGNVFTGTADANKDSIVGLKVGDIVKTTEGKVYGVQAIAAGGTITWVPLSDDTATVAWSRVTNRPTTLTNDSGDASDPTKFYVTNAVLTGDLIDTNSETPASDAGKAVKLNSAGKLGFSITGDAATLESHAASYFATQSWATGIDTEIGNDSTAASIKGRITAIETWDGQVSTALNLADIIGGVSGATLPTSVIPKSAFERLYTVASLSVLADKTTPGYPTDAHNGDTIQVSMSGSDPDKGKMYFIIDETKLGTSNYLQGLNIYIAGEASSVDWSNVQNTPTTLSGYGITDAVNADEKVSTASSANAGKILVLNSNGKLDVDITGDADTLDSHDATYFATQSDMTAVETAIGSDTAGSESGILGRIKALESTVGDATSGLVKDMADAQGAISAIEGEIGDASTSGTIIYRIASLEAGIDASKVISGTLSYDRLPADVHGNVYDNVADANKDSIVGLKVGDIVKTTDGKIYALQSITTAGDPAVTTYGWVLLVNISGSSVAWSQLTGIPTTIIKSGTAAVGEILLSNAVISSDVTNDGINASTGAGDTTKAGKIVSIGSDGKVKADVTHMGGHAASYYEWLEYNSTEAAEAAGAVEGQIILLPVT